MKRDARGRGRALLALGGVLALVGSFLPWYTIGGQALTPRSSNAFEGAGILVFVAAVLTLALVLLPYAVGEGRRLSIDRGATFAFAAGMGVLGIVLRVVQVQAQREDQSLTPFMPERALGLWIAGLGVALMVWGTVEVAARRSTR